MWDKMETPTIVYDLDTSGGLMEVRLGCLLGGVILCSNALVYCIYFFKLLAKPPELFTFFQLARCE